MIVEKRDYKARRRSGSTIVCAYDYEGTSRSNTLVTYGVVEWLKAGDAVSVLVDPTNPERTLLPGAYRRPLPE